MKKAIFLDRDGVINDGTLYYTYKFGDFHFYLGLFEGFVCWRDAGYIFVCHYQSRVVATLTIPTRCRSASHYMCDKLKNKALILQACITCPHYPSITVVRMPKTRTLLIEKLIAALGIENSSY